MKTVIGSNGDLDILTELAGESDFVVTCVSFYQSLRRLVSYPQENTQQSQQADADDLPATKAILKGLENSHARSGKVPILIHTVRSLSCLAYDLLTISLSSQAPVSFTRESNHDLLLKLVYKGYLRTMQLECIQQRPSTPTSILNKSSPSSPLNCIGKWT